MTHMAYAACMIHARHSHVKLSVLGPSCSPADKHGQCLCSAHCMQNFRCNQLTLRSSQSVVCFREPKSDLGVGSSERPQVMFLDLAWGDVEGQVTYPPSVNSKVVRTVKNPDGQLIFQQHDTQQPKETLRRFRQQPYRQPSTSSQRRMFVHACKRNVLCIGPFTHGKFALIQAIA